MRYIDFYDLQLFNFLMDGYKWYWIEMPIMLKGNTETRIALFQLCDRGPTPLLEGKNAVENYPTSKTYNSICYELGTQNFVW